MKSIVIFSLVILSFWTHAFELTDADISGKWGVASIEMGNLGEIPAGKDDFFQFNNGIFTSSAMGETSNPAPYSLENDTIVISHSSKTEKLKVLEVTEEKMIFIADIYINEKKMSAGNIKFTIRRSSSGN
ncbi:hypothetical protein [Glaciecola sp. SC05]|uniref:hypothetical protein n=1 Tax=Glaciecola sp. SC05 TaxID=1987355 RepID=UPI00352965E2